MDIHALLNRPVTPQAAPDPAPAARAPAGAAAPALPEGDIARQREQQQAARRARDNSPSAFLYAAWQARQASHAPPGPAHPEAGAPIRDHDTPAPAAGSPSAFIYERRARQAEAQAPAHPVPAADLAPVVQLVNNREQDRYRAAVAHARETGVLGHSVARNRSSCVGAFTRWMNRRGHLVNDIQQLPIRVQDYMRHTYDGDDLAARQRRSRLSSNLRPYLHWLQSDDIMRGGPARRPGQRQ